MVESRSVIRNAKNARGLERDRARLNFAFNTFPLRILSESLAQATLIAAAILRSKKIRLTEEGRERGVGRGGQKKNACQQSPDGRETEAKGSRTTSEV